MDLTGFAKPRGTITDLGVGVLMLDTHFRRLPGDIGNGQTWSFPVQFKVVKGASPHRVVQEADPTLLKPFIDAAMELVELGVGAISTSCGFLALFQKELQAALPVPVASSSLLQVPLAKAMLPAGKKVGILTFQADKLTERHLKAVDVDPATPVEGLLPGSHFHGVYGNHGIESDPDQLEAELLEAAKRLLKREPHVGALVLECTNMPLHSASLHRLTGLPVFDIVGLIDWLGRSLRPPQYPVT